MNPNPKYKVRARQKSAPGKQAAATVLSGPILTPDLGTVPPTTLARHGGEWVRLPKPGELLCGMTRSYLHRLAANGTIRSLTVCQPGKTRGVRLLYLPSIHGLLDYLDETQNASKGTTQ